MRTREDIISLVSSKECRKYVERRVAECATFELPKLGTVAGQAVSSFVVEFLGLDNKINPVVNDIDFFVVINAFDYEANRNGQWNALKELVAKRDLNKTATFSKSTVYLSGYGEVFRNAYKTEKVLTSNTYGNINKTILLTRRGSSEGAYATMSGEYQRFFTMSILSNFDINSTQVGYTVNSDEVLSFTSEFIDFLETQSLMITRLNTPNQSYIRLKKKLLELGEVYADLDLNRRMVEAQGFLIEAQERIPVIYDEEGNIIETEMFRHKGVELPVCFGEKHANTYKELGIDEFSIKRLENGLYTFDTDKKAGEAFLSEYEKQGGFELLPVDDRKLTENAFLENYSGLPKYLEGVGSAFGKVFLNEVVSTLPKAMKSKKSTLSTLGAIKRVEEKEAEKNYRYMDKYALFMLASDNTTGFDMALHSNPHSVRRAYSLFKKLFSHNQRLSVCVWDASLVLEEQGRGSAIENYADIALNIFNIEKKYPILIAMLEEKVNGYAIKNRREGTGSRKVVDEIANFIDLESSEAYVSGLYDEAKGKVWKESKLSFEAGEYEVVELTTQLEFLSEASSQRHCVGGYGSRIKRGEIILSVRPKDRTKRKDKQMTIHLVPSERHDPSFITPVFPFTLLDKVFNKWKKPYVAQQIRHRFNKEATLDKELVKVLKYISKHIEFNVSYHTLDVPKELMFSEAFRAEEGNLELFPWLGKNTDLNAYLYDPTVYCRIREFVTVKSRNFAYMTKRLLRGELWKENKVEPRRKSVIDDCDIPF